jgi:hypothetical protein
MRPIGQVVDDFHFVRGARSLHVVNALSPAVTASLAISERIVAELDGISIPTTRSARQKPAGLPAKAFTEATPTVWRMT